MSTETLSPDKKTERTKGRRRVRFAFAATLVAVVAGASFALVRPESTVVASEPQRDTSATPAELAEVRSLRIFFGHQSVGQNIVDAIPAIYAEANVTAPRIIESSVPQGAAGSYIEHAFIGTNGDPAGKVADFERIMRAGVGNDVDLAGMKFCYIDFDDTTDVALVFNLYRDAMSRLERDYPSVTFLYLTVPVTTERSIVTRVKDRIGLSEFNSPADNVVRERFNEMIRAEYAGTGRLFDIAAAQATHDGSRTMRSYNGGSYYSMDDALASDLGHLNVQGATVVGAAFLASVAQADASSN